MKHYWIIDPAEKTFEAYTLKSAKYVLTTAGNGNDKVCAEPFDGLTIPLPKLWWPR